MTKFKFTKNIILKDEEIPDYLRKLGKKGYCVLWYHKDFKDAISYTLYSKKIEAEKKIKEEEKIGFICKAKLIKL